MCTGTNTCKCTQKQTNLENITVSGNSKQTRSMSLKFNFYIVCHVLAATKV